MENYILSILIFFPLIGIPLILILPARFSGISFWITLIFLTLPLFLTLYIYSIYDPANPIRPFSSEYTDLMLIENAVWIEQFHINYTLGVDGISLSLVILTSVISISGLFITRQVPHKAGFYSLYLLLFTGMTGVFLALDFFLFYVFWELMLFPMYFLIGIWGGERREYAAIKFFLFTLVGSIFMLLVLILFYLFSDINPDPEIRERTLNIVQLAEPGVLQGPFADGLSLMDAGTFRILIWISLFIAFAVKIPVFPLHSWLPVAHVEASTPISVILAGILLKMGIYGILRILLPVLPDQSVLLAPYFLAMAGVINILYGSLNALAQTDLKRLVAFSSIAHMGFALLGISSLNQDGFNGAVFQMFTHGTISAMLFISVGVLYDRVHHRDITRFGGVIHSMPRFSVLAALAFFAGLALPGLSSFVSEALCLFGAFAQHPYYTIAAAAGIILAAAYFLNAFQKIFFGNPDASGIKEDLKLNEFFALLPLAALTLVLGIYPSLFLDTVEKSVFRLSSMFF
ncbi:MAG: NADH-quinone oxidoreductase subunit M [Spirochaetia bacterium]|nr:NADH-quinone oxidoreductase subunit M [Spirochaetia bacterium]